ncbi:1,5-anhydro-D-fructose reductase [Zootermopsis nevadensis]|uniref:1,5-anhydro-D-fructose reductase n=1 Tax=Zootermopsis nevadensis TaxID=136037 RepID=A0A067RMT5_ZOONE|nr:1,5-anhydro-D-fructose reductase [Zootermopsis nevadensis]
MILTVKLNDNLDFPIIGLGTYNAGKEGEVEEVVKHAIDIGYRHIDGALVYENEKEVGAAIKAKIAEGVIMRDDIFVTSKLWNTYHKPELVMQGIKKTLSDLGLEYLDLYLVHWPFAFQEGGSLMPKDENDKFIPSDVDYLDTWKVMEECVKLGLTKSVGLSNFNSEQIQRVLDVATIKPVVNQVECHPYFNQSKMIAFCKERGIVVTAYAPFGRPGSTVNYIRHDVAPLLQDTKLQEIATKRDKTVAQVILRYLIQHGVVPIPKSSNKSRLQENFDVFNFELTPVEISSIDALNSDSRIFTYSLFADLKDYPFNTEF